MRVVVAWQDYYDAKARPRRKPPPEVKAAEAALAKNPLETACSIPGLVQYLRVYNEASGLERVRRTRAHLLPHWLENAL